MRFGKLQIALTLVFTSSLMAADAAGALKVIKTLPLGGEGFEMCSPARSGWTAAVSATKSSARPGNTSTSVNVRDRMTSRRKVAFL